MTKKKMGGAIGDKARQHSVHCPEMGTEYFKKYFFRQLHLYFSSQYSVKDNK